MKPIMLIAGLVGACFLGGSLAQAQTPPNACLVLNNGAPRMITGMAGPLANQNSALNAAMSNWSQQVMPFGGQYQFWNKAARKNTACTPTKKGFSWVYTCRATAQPCK